jgi:hypothetical protein
MAFEMNTIVGTGNAQELICQIIRLGTPVLEIREISKTVIIDNCRVVFDKVIIDGRLRKDILFKTAEEGFLLPGNVRACSGVTQAFAAKIRDIDVDIAFNALIPVPGARPDDDCVVLQAFVEGEKEEAADIHRNGTFKTLIDKSIIFLCVRVVRPTTSTSITSTTTAATTTCPTVRSQGFFPGGDGTIPRARPGIIPGTFIGPTLIFPGVLNPGRATTLPLANPTVNNPGTIIEIIGGVPTITSATNVIGTTI